MVVGGCIEGVVGGCDEEDEVGDQSTNAVDGERLRRVLFTAGEGVVLIPALALLSIAT
jgi:hypothetical protein